MGEGGPPPTFGTRLPRTIAMIAAFGLLVIVALNTLSTPGGSSSGPAVGAPMPPFAAPLAASTVKGDVNVATRTGQGAAGDRPACDVRGPGILTSCDLVRGRPAALAFFVPGRARCVDELDTLARAARAVPGVRIAAIALRGDRGKLVGVVRDHGWRFPVAYDRDAILGNLYGVAVCPQITFVLPGGHVQGTTVGALDAARLTARLRELQAAATDAAGDDGRRMSGEAPIEAGPVAESLRAEFPELQVLSCEVEAPPGRSTDPGSLERLALLASRMRGGRAVELRREPVPAAYRVFFRHIGIDPDSTRTPVEEAALARLVEGGHRSRGPLADALLLALLDTGVPVNAFAAGAVTGIPGLRPAEARRASGRGRGARAAGRADRAGRRRAPARGAVRRARPRGAAGPPNPAAAARRGADPGRAVDPRRGGAVDVPGVARRRSGGVDSAAGEVR